MRWNVTKTEVQAAADAEAWETVDITPVARVASIQRAGATAVGGLVLFGAVVGAGLWPEETDRRQTNPGTEVCPPTAAAVPSQPTATPSMALTREADPHLAPSVVEANSSIVVLLPAWGEVILGDTVALAGRVNGPRPGRAAAQASWLHVVIVLGDVRVGEAELQVVGQGFAGSIPILEQARGQVADLKISDGRRPDHILFEQRIVLGPGR